LLCGLRELYRNKDCEGKQNNYDFGIQEPIPLAAQSKVCGRSLAGMAGLNPTAGIDVCCECCVLSGRILCDGPIPCPEESYILCV
jgi:hypothetical protein